MDNRPTIICLTPVRNEAWILDRFLACASLWADAILIADQASDDGSVEIALKYSKVELIHNPPEGDFDEFQMRHILLETALKKEGKKILVALDADEVLYYNDQEWQKILDGPSGTMFHLDIVNIRPDMKTYWREKNFYRVFIDDGTPYTCGKIHTNILPVSLKEQHQHITKSLILHYQYSDWARMESKHRWYQCWELIHRHLNPIYLYRVYHHRNAVPKKKIQCLNNEWFKRYTQAGIDMFSVKKDAVYRWDKEVEAYFQKYGKKRFAMLDIWENTDGTSRDNREGGDCRTFFQKGLHRYLRLTQPLHKSFVIKMMDKILKGLFTKRVLW